MSEGASTDTRPSGFETFSGEVAFATNYISWVLDAFAPYLRGDILEVGLGHGSYQPYLAGHGRYLGVDIDAGAVARAQARFPGADFAVADVTDAALAARVGGEPFDAVLCFNVLEHIEDDALAVRRLLELVRPGGALLLGVPALQALYNDLDRPAGHHRRYHKRDLAALVPATGCTLRRLEYFNPVGALGWWANNFVSHQSLDAPTVNRQVRLFDRYILPISRLINPLTRRVFGQSVICVLERT